MVTKIPATIITGFLGAGKTTLIRHMLQNARGRRIALIINEFGDLGVDGDILKGCGDETCSEDDVMELSNGCICCTVADDFIPTMEKLLTRENKPDHIVIETSGLALPQPLVRAFNWPKISTQVTVDGVVTVVDGKAVTDVASRHEVHHHHDHDDRTQVDEDDHHKHDHDAFESFVVNLGEVADTKVFADQVSQIISTHDILRLKGFAAVVGKPMRLTLQAVGPRVETYFDQPFDMAPRITRLVVIGQTGLDRPEIEAALNACTINK